MNHGNPAARKHLADFETPGQMSPESVTYYQFDEKREHSWTPTAGAIRAVRFWRAFDGMEKRGRAVIDIRYLDHAERLVQRYVRHSPDGFEFGYHGSGPADAALNLLAMFIPVKEATRLGMYQLFKGAFVANVDQENGGTVDGAAIREWITKHWAYNDEHNPNG